MRTITLLPKKDIDSYETIHNKLTCAQQAMRPNAVPPYAPVSARDKFFREAIFAYADAQYLQEYFWRDLARRHGVEPADQPKLEVDFNTSRLLMRE
jgi:hypothetical protein